MKPKTENKQTKKSKEEKDLNIVIPYICRCYGLKHISHTFLVYMYWGAIIILSMQIKKIEAERHSLSQSVKIQTQSPSANSTSFPITPPRLSSKSIRHSIWYHGLGGLTTHPPGTEAVLQRGPQWRGRSLFAWVSSLLSCLLCARGCPSTRCT